MADSGAAELYPLFLKLAGRRVLVIGAGAVAERKVTALLSAGAAVVVVAPAATAAVARLSADGVIAWHERRFVPEDVDGAWLVVAATADPEVQRLAAAEAEARRIFVLAVDDIPNATAYSGAIVRRPPFVLAISSSGETPALTRLFREIIEWALPGQEWVAHAKKLRAEWIAAGTPAGERFGQLVRAFAARSQ